MMVQVSTSDVFSSVKTIAIVGLSDNPDRYSYKVASYFLSKGFHVIPVNPKIKEVFGKKSYPDLLSIPKNVHIDIVDIFRKSEFVLPHVMEAIERKNVKTIWMQEGVSNKQASKLAKQNGLEVVENTCMMIAHKNTK